MIHELTEAEYRFNAHEVARMLGRPVRTICHLAQNGILPAIKKGPKLWLFPNDRELLIALLLAGKSAPKNGSRAR